MAYGNYGTNNGNNAYAAIGTDAAQTAMGWAKEPCPSQQPVTVPLDYLADCERSKGVVVGVAAGVAALVALFFAAKCLKD